MSVTVTCPQCGSPLEAPEELPAGKRLQCPECAAAFGPPDTGLKAANGRAEPGTAAARPRRPRHDDEDDDRAPPRRRGRAGTVALVVGAVVIAFVVLGICGAVLTSLLSVGDPRREVKMAAPMPAPPPVAGPAGGGAAPMAPGGAMMGDGPAQPMPKPGEAAPAIDGVGLDGRPMKLSDFKGKVVLLYFWADASPFCRQTYAFQNGLINRLKGKDFVLLGVNGDDVPQTAQTAVRNAKLAWRSWFDGGGRGWAGPVAQRYGVNGQPNSFLLDRNGVVRKVYVGVAAEPDVDRDVDQALAVGENRPPNAPPRWQPGSRAFGQLADEAAVGPYRVRPPSDYLLDKVPPQPDVETYRWQGPARPGVSAPVFEVSLSPAPPARDLRALLEKEVEAIAGPRRLGWSCGPAERGEVNGLIFMRARWSIQEQPQKWAGAGVIYVAFDGDRLVRVSIREPVPNSGGPLEAAPLTLHKAAK